MQSLRKIKVVDIEPAPDHNRETGGYDAKGLEELAESIRTVGLQQPIIVRIHGDKYQVVAGERRRRAVVALGLDETWCITLGEIDDREADRIRTVENLHRENLHPLDEARMFVKLLDATEVKALAAEIGKSEVHVRQRIQLLKLIPKAMEAFKKNQFNVSVALVIARLAGPQQMEVLEYMGRRGTWGPVTQSDIERWVSEKIHRDLANAAFDKGDADLVSGAGKCADCTKRTGYEKMLFPEIKKKDLCLDPVCYEKKTEKVLITRLKQSPDVQPVADDYTHQGEKLPAGTLSINQWTKCSKGTEGAMKCLVVTGKDKGKIVYGTRNLSAAIGRGHKSDAEKAKEKKERDERKLENEARRIEYDAVIEKAAGQVGSSSLPLKLLRVVTTKVWDSTWDVYRKKLSSIEGWEIPKDTGVMFAGSAVQKAGLDKISKYEAADCELILVKLALVGELDPTPQYSSANKGELLHTVASMYGISHKDAIKLASSKLTFKTPKNRSAKTVAGVQKRSSSKREAGQKAGQQTAK